MTAAEILARARAGLREAGERAWSAGMSAMPISPPQGADCPQPSLGEGWQYMGTLADGDQLFDVHVTDQPPQDRDTRLVADTWSGLRRAFGDRGRWHGPLDVL